MVLGACCLLTACQPGLDLHKPSDAREYVRQRARGYYAEYCRALLSTLQTSSGPVSVLLPNQGDDDILAELKAFLAEKGLTLADFRRNSAQQAALARANIFAVDHLSTGTFATLDGTPHGVRCGADAALPEHSCQIGDLRGLNTLADDARATGSVYLVRGQRNFFQF